MKTATVAAVADVSARQTPAGFAMTITGHDAEGRSCAVDVTFDWLWFKHVAGALGGVLAARDASTQAMRAAAADVLR